MTFATLIRTRPDRNGNSRRAWIVSSHASNLEAFVQVGAAGEGGAALTYGLQHLTTKDPDRYTHLSSSPYTNGLGIFVPVAEFRRLKALARETAAVVEIG